MPSANPPKLLIGLTGGIGSGKSEVGRRFQDLGVTVVDADAVARQVVEPGEPALKEIGGHFGPRVLTDEGHLDRRTLREIVFAEPAEREWLEALLHPLINQEIRQQLAAADSDCAMLMSPLLLETGQDKLVDRVLVVDAPEAAQLNRVRLRDQAERQQIEAIMARQMPRKERLARAQDVIHNHGRLDDLEPQIQRLNGLYRRLCQDSGAQRTEP